MCSSDLLVVTLLWLWAAPDAFAQSTYYLWTGQSGAQTQVDINHKSSWYITVATGSSFTFGGGKFDIKKGSRTSASISLKLYQNNSAGALLAIKTVSASDVTQSFSNVDFSLASTVTLTAPPPITVAVTPSSATVQTGSTQPFAATVTGSANTAVTWSVNGTAGGNAQVGFKIGRAHV